MKREDRYIVIKRKDIDQALSPAEQLDLNHICNIVQDYRSSLVKPPLKCVVVESDWPEYEPTWKAIEARVYADVIRHIKITAAFEAIANTAQENPDRCMVDVCNDNFIAMGIPLSADWSEDGSKIRIKGGGANAKD